MEDQAQQKICRRVSKARFNELIAAHILFHKLVFLRLKGSGLTAGQPKILEFLAERGQATQSQIARASDIEAPTAARILSKMETAGLIHRVHSAQNRRSIIVSLTAVGESRANLVAEVFRQCEAAALRGVKEKDEVLRLLERVEYNLRAAEEEEKKIQREPFFHRTLHYKLLICQTLLRKHLYTELSDTALTSGQPKVLEFLSHREGCQQKEIAQACLIEPATVTSILWHMQRAELIERREEDGNRRSLHVYLTERGRRMAERTEFGIQQTVKGAFQGIEARQTAFGKALRQIHENLREEIEKEKQEELCQKKSSSNAISFF